MSGDVRYARQLVLSGVGQAGQAKLAETCVLLVGVGGLGCPAAQYLASSGVGTLLLNDFDRVDASNLPRQILFDARDVGEHKVVAAKKRLEIMNPDVNVECLIERLDEPSLQEVVGRVQIVLDCTDNFATRLAVNRACVAAKVPLVSGAAVRFEGQIAVFSNRTGGPCYRCVYDDEDEWLGNCQGNGVLAPVPGVIGTLMAAETLQLALGMESGLDGRLLLWDSVTADWQAVKIRANPDCPECQRS